MRKNILSAVFSCSLFCLVAGPALGQAYPARPIRFVLPFPPGGPTDMLGRAIAQKVAEQTRQQVIPDNRPGAGGNLGLELAAKAAPDGYTMTLTSPIIASAPALYRKLNYRQSDLAPVSLVADIPNVVLVHPSVPAKSVKELIAIARGSPGKLNFGSGGVGTTTHLVPERIMARSRTKMTHVPFKGSGLALVALMAGEIDVLVMAVPAAQGQVKARKARALAVMSTERVVALPDVPTARELGIEDYIVPLWYGILAPAGTSADHIHRLNAEIVRAMQAPDLRQRLEAVSIQPRTSTPEEFGRFIRQQTPMYAEVVRDAGIQPR